MQKCMKSINPLWREDGLIPDEVISASLLKRVGQPDAENGFVLDGYPRTIAQVYKLEKILLKTGQDIEKVFLVNVDDELIYDRVLNRKNCLKCGKIYNKQTIKATDGEFCKCGGKLVKRQDDTKEIVKTRIEEFNSRIEKILDYYKEKGVLREVDGNKDPETILERVK